MCQDTASGKVTSLPQQQWHNVAAHSHSKTPVESSSWDDLVAAVKGAGKLVLHVIVIGNITC